MKLLYSYCLKDIFLRFRAFFTRVFLWIVGCELWICGVYDIISEIELFTRARVCQMSIDVCVIDGDLADLDLINLSRWIDPTRCLDYPRSQQRSIIKYPPINPISRPAIDDNDLPERVINPYPSQTPKYHTYLCISKSAT